MKFAERYQSFSNEKKNLFILACIAVVGLAVFVCGFFVNNPGLFFGWGLGSVIEILSYLTIVASAKWMLTPNSNSKLGYVAPLIGMARLLLYTAGLVLGAFCTFVWGDVAHGYCNFWTVFAAYLPMGIVLLSATFGRLKKESAALEKKDEENKK